MNLSEIGSSVNVNTRDGSDLVIVDKLYGSLFIDSGDSDDEVRIHHLGGNGTILGGNGRSLNSLTIAVLTVS